MNAYAHFEMTPTVPSHLVSGPDSPDRVVAPGFRNMGRHALDFATGIPTATGGVGPPDLLDSWKQIAAYVNRNVRTAQRWEKRENLPVHRHFHRKACSVYARKELARKLRICPIAQKRSLGTRKLNLGFAPQFTYGLALGQDWSRLLTAGSVRPRDRSHRD